MAQEICNGSIISCKNGPFLYFLQIIVADMRKVLAKNPQIEQQRLHRRVFLDNINPENQALMVRLYAGICEVFIDILIF